MKLNVLERLTALGLIPHMPQKGSLVYWKIIDDLTATLAMSEKEFKKFGIKQVGEQITWNPEGSKEREIELGEKATELICDALKKLEKEEALERNQVLLHKKFVEK